MPFGFGASSSSTDSSSSSFDRSSAESASGGFGVASSQDNIAFEDIFSRLFGGAEGAAAGLDPSMITDTANQLFSGGMGVMDQLGGDAGSQYLEGRLTEDNPVLQQQIDLLGEDLGNFFSEQLNPAITSEAVGGGQLGGGRQGVAQGLAMEHVGDLFTQGATSLRAGDIAARDSAAGVLSENNIAGSEAYLQNIPALMDVMGTGFAADMMPYQMLTDIMGGPTTLNTSSSASADFSSSNSSSYGQSEAKSRSRGKSVSIG